MRNEPTVLSFDELKAEIYENQDNVEVLEGIAEYVMKNKYKYCLVDLTMLLRLIFGCIEYKKQSV